MKADPIHQFQITKLFTIARIGSVEIAFTNSALFMLIAVMGIVLLLLGTTRARALVPGRLQSLAEVSYEFVADTLKDVPETAAGVPIVSATKGFDPERHCRITEVIGYEDGARPGR